MSKLVISWQFEILFGNYKSKKIIFEKYKEKNDAMYNALCYILVYGHLFNCYITVFLKKVIFYVYFFNKVIRSSETY